MAAALSERNAVWLVQAEPKAKQGYFSSFFAGLFDDSDGEDAGLRIRPAVSAALLLPLYDIVQSNAAFITVLTHTRVLGGPRRSGDAVATPPSVRLTYHAPLSVCPVLQSLSCSHFPTAGCERAMVVGCVEPFPCAVMWGSVGIIPMCACA